MIAVAAFACGPDAVLLESVEKLCRRRDRPFLKLILDEHTGEAGLVTRFEAFVACWTAGSARGDHTRAGHL